MTSASFTDHLLIAMPNLADPNFSQTVTLICEHTADGALGLVINRPLDLQVGELLEQIDIDISDPSMTSSVTNAPVYAGGPVATNQGFILHQPVGDWQATLAVNKDVGLTTSSDILTAMSTGNGPEHTLVTLGYAGWGPGQLEQEITDNSWLTVESDTTILFDTGCDQRWHAAAHKLGIDLNLLSGDAGHA